VALRNEWKLTTRAPFGFVEQLDAVDAQRLLILSFSEILRGFKLKAVCPKIEWQIVRTNRNSKKEK